MMQAEVDRTKKRILIMTSVAAEQEAILRGIGSSTSRFNIELAGVGPAAAAANTATALAKGSFDLVISAGICGGFPEHTEIGSLVVASEIIYADLGAESPEGFISVDELGFGSNRISVDTGLANQLSKSFRQFGLSVHTGPILTVSTATGTAQTALELAKRIPGAAAEAMEGYGVAIAAQNQGIPVLEIRAVSNAVGPRDRSAWRIKDALAALEAASSTLLEVLS